MITFCTFCFVRHLSTPETQIEMTRARVRQNTDVNELIPTTPSSTDEEDEKEFAEHMKQVEAREREKFMKNRKRNKKMATFCTTLL